MLDLPLPKLLVLLAPIAALGFAAGVLRAVALRPQLAARRRRGLTAAWVLLLLVGAPFWLVVAALLDVW